jgi:TonB family protein
MLQPLQLQQIVTRYPSEVAELREFLAQAGVPLDDAASLPGLTACLEQDRTFRRDLVSHIWVVGHAGTRPVSLPDLLGILTVSAAGLHFAATADDADAHTLLRFLMEARRSFDAASAPSQVMPVRTAAPATAPFVPESHNDPLLLRRTEPSSFIESPAFASAYDSTEEPDERKPIAWFVAAASLVLALCLGLWMHHIAAAKSELAAAPANPPAAIVTPSTPAPAVDPQPTQPHRAAAAEHQRGLAHNSTARTSAAAKPSPLVQNEPAQHETRPAGSNASTFAARRAVPNSAASSAATRSATTQSYTASASTNNQRLLRRRTPSAPPASPSGTSALVAKVQPIHLGDTPEDTQPTASAARAATVRPTSLGIMAANVTYSPAPAYPSDASALHVQGEVKVEAEVDPNGNVASARVISGPPLLREAAVSAVEHWHYRPYVANGKPISMSALIVMDFQLP